MSKPEGIRIPTQFVAPDIAESITTPTEPAGPAPETFGPRASFPREQHDRPDAPERDAEAVDATPAAATPSPEAAAPDGPVPLAAGTYAVYDDQAGGYVLVIGTREGETHHKHIPPRVVKMAETMMGGNSPLAAMFGAG